MPRLFPFSALRYTASAGQLEDVLAPPYDVIDAAMAADLRARSPLNSVRLILPEGDVSSRYGRAAADLESWRDAGVLAVDPEPSVYVYRQKYEQDGQPVARLALFAALELVPLDRGDVLPHEHTHAGPKRDRLALTLATRTQMSPVFMAGRDPDSELLRALTTIVDETAPATGGVTEDGIGHALWPVTGDSAERLCRLVDRFPLLIADGHHRYETALEVQRQLEESSATRMLVCVVSEMDSGLVIQPTHRTITDLPSSVAADFIGRLSDRFRVSPLDGHSPAEAAALVAPAPADLAVVHRGSTWRLSPESDSPASGSSAHGIAAVLFDEWILKELLGSDADMAAHDGMLEYHRDPDFAVGQAGESGAAFLLPPVSMDALWTVTSEGIRLPPKSTYFEPKMPSGLLFRPL
jgi:uncharacterized protein (DUF1015 family)